MHFTLEDVLATLAHAAAKRTPPSVLVRVRAAPAAIVQPRGVDDITEPFTQVSDPALPPAPAQ
jgi:hypothetical protein